MLSEFFAVDLNLKFVESMKGSMQYMKGNKFLAFIVLFVGSFLASFGTAITLGIGVIIAYPFMAFTMLSIYLQATGQFENVRPRKK